MRLRWASASPNFSDVHAWRLRHPSILSLKPGAEGKSSIFGLERSSIYQRLDLLRAIE